MINIRPYKITDLELVKNGYQKIFDYDYLSRVNIDTKRRNDIREWVGNYVIKDTTNYHIKFLVAEEDEIPVGFITFGFDNFLKICTVRGIYVKEEMRKKGIAKFLMKAMYQKCLGYSMEKICVNVVEMNSSAVKLYESEGFQKIGEKYSCKL